MSGTRFSTSQFPISAEPEPVRVRDGIALAVTGEIPPRVYAQVLAVYHAERAAKARGRRMRRIYTGTYRLPITYGYRRSRPGVVSAGLVAAFPRDPWPAWEDADLPPAGAAMIDPARVGRAQPLDWRIDHGCAETIRFMARSVRSGWDPARIAAELNADTARPPLLSVHGAPRRWSARTVRDLLTDPTITGYGTWGRTHHGRSLPRSQWIISGVPTHPAILDTTTFDDLVETLNAAPCPRSVAGDTAWERRRR